jgi:hypothetical protein
MKSLIASLALALLASPALAQTAPAAASAAAAPAQPTAPLPPACEGPKFHELDFWMGDWDVTVSGTSQVAGHNLVERVYGGCGLRENWVGAPPSGGSGGSINAYDPTHDEWRQFWLGSGGGITDYHGHLEDGRMVLIAHAIGQSGKPYAVRLIFTPNPDGSVRQTFEYTRDEKTWNMRTDLTYRRAKSG